MERTLKLAASAFQVTNAAVSETMIYAVDGGNDKFISQ